MASSKIKLVLVGDGGVGKTSLLKSFERDASLFSSLFSPFQPTQSSCAIEAHSKSILHLNDKIQYQVWDFAGQLEYSTVHQVVNAS